MFMSVGVLAASITACYLYLATSEIVRFNATGLFILYNNFVKSPIGRFVRIPIIFHFIFNFTDNRAEGARISARRNRRDCL